MATPARMRSAIKGNWRKLFLVLAAAVLLVGAVLLPDTLPELARKLMGLGSGDDTAATPWLRWVLIAAGFALVLLARRWEQVAWADVTLFVVIGLAAAAVLGAYQQAQEASEDVVAETTAFNVEAEKAIAAVQLPRASSIIVLAVEPDKADTGLVLTYASTRYQATLCHALARGPVARDIAITVERGDDEANAAAFASDLRGAETVYLLPGPKRAEAKVDAGAKDEKAKGPARKAGSEKPLPAGCPKKPAQEPVASKPTPCNVSPSRGRAPDPVPSKKPPPEHRQCPAPSDG